MLTTPTSALRNRSPIPRGPWPVGRSVTVVEPVVFLLPLVGQSTLRSEASSVLNLGGPESIPQCIRPEGPDLSSSAPSFTSENP